MSASARGNEPAIALFREACRADSTVITARLSANGFDDLPRNDLIVLEGLSIPGTTIQAGPVAELIREQGINQEAISQAIDALIGRGYLERFIDHNFGDPGNGGIRLTERARAAVGLAKNSLAAVRWADFPFRDGDLVISTSAKSGTTWIQMICALLVFQTPDLPAPLYELSPWLDWLFTSREELFAQLASQRHRRFIKTHLPLSQIPVDSRARYIVIARDPLDARVSKYYHFDNIDEMRIRGKERSHGQRQRMPLHDWVTQWIDDSLGDDTLSVFMAALCDAWASRNEPNVVLVHYEDLSADLEGEMRRLAARLEFTVPVEKWPSLVEAATFDRMRAAADRIQPMDMIKDNTAFFRTGAIGSGRELLTSAELGRYHAQMERLAPPELLAWLHRQNAPTDV
jgi:aryl sulfotransferase